MFKIIKNSKGFTLMEVIVSVGIFVILITAIVQVYVLIIQQIASYREQTEISSLANQYIEIARNLPYSSIGTLNGNPHGDLADLPNALNVNFGGNNYKIYYAVSYVDDPADGTILAGTDFAPNDYKQIKLYIENVKKNVTSNFLTNISPKGLEGMASGGAIYISVINAIGQPVPGATIHITNTAVTPNIDLTRTSDLTGHWIEVALPISANNYHVEVTKNNYSQDQTYPSSLQNQNPTKPDATVVNGLVTSISFAIDELSNLTFKTLDQSCSPISGVTLDVVGSRLIGTSPDVLKFNNSYTSSPAGIIPLSNIEWDTYSPSLTGNNYMVFGSSPIQQVNILPKTTQSFTLIVGSKTDNSLLAIVKDSVTNNPVEGASVQLQTMILPSTFSITSITDFGGTVSPSGTSNVGIGTNKTFNITANSGFSIKEVYVDGTSVGAVSTYTFTNVVENHSIFASFTPNIAWMTGWSYRKKITISNTNVDSDLTNFPLLVKITSDSNMSTALANGYDIRFTDSTGNNLLNYERQAWSGGNGSAVTADFWVNVPTVNHSTTTVIYIYYGKAGALDGQNITGVWDLNYKGVWHAEDNAGNKNVIDSTRQNNGLNQANTNTKSVAGKIDKALNFNGTLDYADLLNNVGGFTLASNFTISAFVNSALDSTDDVIYGNTWQGPGYFLGINSSKKARFILFEDKNKYKGIDSSVLSAGWHYVTGTWDGVNAKIFIDGVENSATNVTKGTVSTISTAENTKIGLDTTTDKHYFKGVIDEVRVFAKVLSANWTKFEYHNLTDAGNNLTFASQETYTPTYMVTVSAGPGGEINPAVSVSVNKGSNQTFVITPNVDYAISDVLVDGVSVGANDTYTLSNVTADHTISAIFSMNNNLYSEVSTKFTGGSVQNQQTWIGGQGQQTFTDITKYFQDDGGVSVDVVPFALRLKQLGGAYVSSGTLTSSTFDTGTDQTVYTTLNFEPTSQDISTNLKFQIATNNDNETWDFTGPDGTANTFYEVSGTTINSSNNGKRYIRYKTFLSTKNDLKTSVLTGVNINYVSGCYTPGQVMFSNLAISNRYKIIVNMSGYQVKTISDLNIATNQSLQILLSH